MTTAKLPVELRAETPRLVSELGMGEMGYVGLRAFFVTPDQDCFLDSKGTLEKPGLLQMTVRRDEEGFHVVLPAEPKFATEQVVKGMTFCQLPQSWFRRKSGLLDGKIG